MKVTETHPFMDLTVASTKHYWCSDKLLSVALTLSLFNTIKCLQPLVTRVCTDSATSSSISQTDLSPALLQVGIKLGVSGCPTKERPEVLSTRAGIGRKSRLQLVHFNVDSHAV